MSKIDLTHEQDLLNEACKKALELACDAFCEFEVFNYRYTDPEFWIERAYVALQSDGWEKK
jgi:hypothetical protein